MQATACVGIMQAGCTRYATTSFDVVVGAKRTTPHRACNVAAIHLTVPVVDRSGAAREPQKEIGTRQRIRIFLQDL